MMNWGIIQFGCLFLATLTLQLVAVCARHMFISLFFSFLHSVFISIILFAMGSLWMALAHLWLSAGISYFSIIQTSVLLGSHKTKHFPRRITISLFIYIIAVSLLFFLSTRIVFVFGNLNAFSNSNTNLSDIISNEHGLTVLILTLLALCSLVGSYLLIRRDDVLTRRRS